MRAPPPAAPDHDAAFEELAGLVALRVALDDERTAFGRHAAACGLCRDLVRADEATLRELSMAVPEMDASPGFKERLMRRAAEELGQAPEPIPLRPPAARPVALRPRAGRAWMFSLAAALAVLVGTLAVGQQVLQNQVVATVPLQAQGPVAGSAVVVVRRSGAATLEMRGMAAPPPGHVYEAWIIQGNAAPLPAGTAPTGEGDVPLDGPVRGSTVAVTIETAPGAAAPTSTPLLAGNVAT